MFGSALDWPNKTKLKFRLIETGRNEGDIQESFKVKNESECGASSFKLYGGGRATGFRCIIL